MADGLSHGGNPGLMKDSYLASYDIAHDHVCRLDRCCVLLEVVEIKQVHAQIEFVFCFIGGWLHVGLAYVNIIRWIALRKHYPLDCLT